MSDQSKPRVRFWRTTFIGAILFLVPISGLILILARPLEIAKKLVAPIDELLPFESVIGLETPVALALLLIIFVCFLAGLFARTRFAKAVLKKLEAAVLAKIPGYELLKGLGATLTGTEGANSYPVVILNMDGIRQIALLIEEEGDDGLVTVFVPDAPNPRSGGVFFVPAELITPTDVPLTSAIKCMINLGAGSPELRKQIQSSPT